MKKSPEQVMQSQFSPEAHSKKNTASIEVEDKIELERREAYLEPKTRDILRYLLQGGDQAQILPIYRTAVGYVYELPDPGNEKFNNMITKEHLLDLARLGIL